MPSMGSQIKASALNAADMVRERETYRYLNTANIHAYVDDPEQPLPAARPCPDSALAAFAQLALLRLSSQRAFICLLDRTYCYTVAEATASSKSRPSGNQDVEHGLVFCGTAIRHTFSLPSRILEAAIASLSLTPGESNSLPLPVLAIPDLRKDDRFCSVPVVAVEDSLRSCVGVPIKSHNGAIVGVFCLLDSQLRAGLSHVDTEFLRDMSKTIMDQLDLYHSRRELDRSTRMVRGLGSFVENRGTMSGFSGDMRRRTSDGERGREGILNDLQQEALRKTEEAENTQYATAPFLEGSTLSSAAVPTDGSDQSQQRSSPIKPLAESRSEVSNELPLSLIQPAVESSLAPDDEQSREGDEAIPVSTRPAQPTTTNPQPPADELQQLFSRAANIIRESIEVEGVLFFDASVGYWGGSLESHQRDASEGGSSTTSAKSSSGDDDALPMRSTSRPSTDEPTCDVFGFSMTDGSSIDGKKPSVDHLTVPERFLRILLRRYPTGKIFNFTADGSHISDTETEEDSIHTPAPAHVPARIRRKRYKSYLRVDEAALIVSIFPGARSVLAFPLWDSHRERWFAGGVVWTRTPTRVFSIKGELSYLRAFGMVAMAEVAQIEVQTANKSKMALLSSISHELRSPLHGILGGVDILQSTEIDVFQSNTIRTVETCGVMLLDTIEHLLTQSEINQSVRLAKLQRRKQRKLPRPHNAEGQTNSKTDTPFGVEIDAIVEEVIESMFAGYEYMYLSRPSLQSTDERVESPKMAARGPASIHDASPSLVQESVKIILDIQASASWTFGLGAGALRRVVMNLVGNALKYTTAGYIKVTVTQRELSKKSVPQLSEIKITVEDTGKGIGVDYLSNHLFKPFSQEDTLSQGTGLGLSITHQIVASLDGKIDVQSIVGQGTAISIFLRLTHSVLTEGLRAKSMFLAQTRRTRGLRVSLLGFHEDAGAASGKTSGEVPKADVEWQLLRASIELLCKDWLYMDVLAASETSMRPDMYIATQAGAQRLAAMKDAGIHIQPVVVICGSTAIAYELTKSSKTSDRFGVFEYLSQPCGPRKLAKTLTLCLDRWADMQVEQAIQGQSPLQLAALAHVQRTLPTRTQSALATSLQTEPAHEASDDTLPISPNPSIERQQLEHHPFYPSKPLEPQSPRHKSPPTSGLALTAHVAPFLIVDDNDINIRLLSTYLSRKSLPFTTASDGVLAVAAYKATRGNFSCVFMDIQMPHMDGITATRTIREYEREERLEAVTVVALTGLATEERQREAEANGINEFFAKPVRLKALDEILERTKKTVRNC